MKIVVPLARTTSALKGYTMSKHAFLSASGAPAWTRCYAKPWREKDLPDETSVYAAEGTLAHEHLSWKVINWNTADFDKGPAVSNEMKHHVLKTLAEVSEYAHESRGWFQVPVHSECRVSIEHITGEKDAGGTADIVIVDDDTLIVIDLKYGMGVKVEAEDNEQLLIYAAAALAEFDLIGEIKSICMVISQPRLDHRSEWTLTTQELQERIEPISRAASEILKGGDHLLATPGVIQCKFCKVKGTCSEYRDMALAIVTDDFVDLDSKTSLFQKVKAAEERLVSSDDNYLATCFTSVELIEQWCKAVKEEMYKRLSQDRCTDTRFKLVAGKMGNRKWKDEEGAREVAIAHGFENDIYKSELLSPTAMEKVLPEEVFVKLTPYISRAEGKPIIVQHRDPRPALNLELDFNPIEDEDMADALLGLTKKDKE